MCWRWQLRVLEAATLCVAGYRLTCWRLQSYRGCSPMYSRLQPYVSETAALCTRGRRPMACDRPTLRRRRSSVRCAA